MTGEFKEVPSMLLVNSSTNKVSCGMNFRLLKSSYLGQQSYKNLKSYVSPNHAWSAVSASSSNEASDGVEQRLSNLCAGS
uniref:Uncharacterized protein n=1 Tax=Ditylenchus dipsaci TaxID=166011 RepID=A0A915DMB6_9BILA